MVSLTNAQKQAICRHKSDHPSLTQADLSRWAKTTFNLTHAPTQPTMSNILKRKAHFLEMTDNLSVKRARSVKHPEVERALVDWILQCQHNGARVNGDLICEKAKRLAELCGIPEEDRLNFSSGWLSAFLARNQFKGFKSHGESGSANNEAIVEALPQLIAATDRYALGDIYNMDETGLFYKMAPTSTIARDEVEGLKKDKTRLTVALTANADGTDKRELFIIGKSERPRCFNRRFASDYGFYYRNNLKAWMNGEFFREWLRKFDASMREENRHILLILDNAPSHVANAVELTNIEIIMLPPNATSKIQPMDAGIIMSFKRRYRRYQLRRAVDSDEAGRRDLYNVDQLQAMRWMRLAWNEVTPQVIQNCWKHTNIISARGPDGEIIPPVDGAVNQQDAGEIAVEQELADSIHALRIRNAMSIENLLNDDEEDANLHVQQDDEGLVQRAAGEAVEESDDETEENLLPDKDKLAVLRDCIKLFEEEEDPDVQAMKGLRRLQRAIRDKLKKEREEGLHQTTLDSFLARA